MSFKDITGHSKIINYLKSQIKSRSFSHSYIFSGPAGIGKKKVAVEFAKTLNCITGINSENYDSCDTCNSCNKISKSIHPDVHIIDFQWQMNTLSEELPKSGRNVIKIETIRIIEKEIGLKPYEGRYKIFIIDSAESLNIQAANCLLKTLEEPPPNSIIILIVNSGGDLPLTIVSRCEKIKFFPLTPTEIKNYFEKNKGVDKNLIKDIIFYSNGSIGNALMLLESADRLYGIKNISTLWHKLKKKNINETEILQLAKNISFKRENVDFFMRYLINVAECDLKNNPEKFLPLLEFLIKKAESLRYNININMFLTHILLYLNQELKKQKY